MAKVIGVMGESGSGKTTSMRNLDPRTTYYIDCDKKGLSWKGWRDQYNKEAKNYIRTDKPDTVMSALNMVNVNSQAQHIETVVVDTINGIMVADEMRRCKEKGYDKWQDLAQSVYNIVDYALTMRENVTVIFLAHTQTDHDDNGYMFTRIKTNGKKLNKIVLESKFSTVLLAKNSEAGHFFETSANMSTAKTPMGAFETLEIPNDIVEVLNVLKDY